MLLLRLSFSPRRHQFTLSVQVDRMEPTKKLERRHSSCAGAAGRRSRRLERCATPQRSTVGHLLNGRDDEVVQRVWRAPTVSWPAVGAQVGRERPGHLSWIREREEPDAGAVVQRNVAIAICRQIDDADAAVAADLSQGKGNLRAMQGVRVDATAVAQRYLTFMRMLPSG
jgi:hypothetical protein